MIIQVDGINTKNKGAELMLIAVLEELESRFPNATVYLNANGDLNLQLLPDFKLDLRKRFFLGKAKTLVKALRKLHLPYKYFTHFYAKRGIDLMVDASGFQYSDQWKHSVDQLESRNFYYRKLKSYGTKLVMLPQAFGPFQTNNGKRSVDIISDSFDLIFAREQQSYDYLVKAGAKEDIVKRSCDFTFKVTGRFDDQVARYTDHVCIIPNKKMITHTNAGSSYLELMNRIIDSVEELGKKAFLLNHEGCEDEKLCHEINLLRKEKLPILTGLSAKEVKGVIGNSYLVISSRFHGVASALSQAIPCLATSWNHKYEMLFKDFGQTNTIIRVEDNWSINAQKISKLIGNRENVINILKSRKHELVNEIDSMWDTTFEN
ncbi:polysaccharide pyruvyl transferase family protein [Sphingobacterium sp. DN00404]|uniref:Polysaccharide pyruvyl transferase family protein n=1 Tax=Sphingobacterium micropteri TaxID=2763501 RepID=A0ABR7YKA3_9SPHI|nr:polysaccharide pyruvyl transferase family protein [Sphingobacterium micropteri]MBD1431742.1 polysaccharide pyruvyl transferase family protein [Sphingobacterium micropteri]